MPIDYRDYPNNWDEISRAIREDRAESRCECTGECGIDHQREAVDHDRELEEETEGLIRLRADWDWRRCLAQNNDNHPVTGSRVVLTVAHLDHDTTNSDPANLRAFCQRCHNKYDAPHRAISRANTRRRKQADAGQLVLEL